jgi:hypothetical protein
MPVPEADTLRLNARKDFKLLGTHVTGVDNHAPWSSASRCSAATSSYPACCMRLT